MGCACDVMHQCGKSLTLTLSALEGWSECQRYADIARVRMHGYARSDAASLLCMGPRSLTVRQEAGSQAWVHTQSVLHNLPRAFMGVFWVCNTLCMHMNAPVYLQSVCER